MASTLYSPGTVVRSIWLNEVDKATHNYLTSVAGVNTITATGPLTELSYVTGDRFYLVPSVTNTSAVTLNINGLGAKNILKASATGLIPLVANDLIATCVVILLYDGVQFQVINTQTTPVVDTGRLINTQTFLASGTYTPTPGTTRILVEGQGAGGAGGGTPATGAGQLGAGGGGGSGGISKSLITSGFSGVSVTIGAGGTPVSGATGGTGGVTSFGALVTFPGGTGGSASSVSAVIAATGGAPGTGTGGTVYNMTGNFGQSIVGGFSLGAGAGGAGANSLYGGGGGATVNGLGGSAAGIAAVGRGAGGSGAFASNGGGAAAGGAGGAGIIIVYEYS